MVRVLHTSLFTVHMRHRGMACQMMVAGEQLRRQGTCRMACCTLAAAVSAASLVFES